MSQENINALRRDIADIVYYLFAPEPQDDSEQEWERFEDVMRMQDYYEQKYGESIINQIGSMVHDIPHRVKGIHP